MAYPLSLGKYKLEIDAYGFVLKNPIALAVGVSIFLITKSIWTSIIAHIINNSYASLQMVYVSQKNFGNEWIVIGWLSLVVVVSVLIYIGYPRIKEYFMNYDKRYAK